MIEAENSKLSILYKKDFWNNYIHIAIGLFIFVISLIFIILIIINNLGWFLLFLPILFLIFSIGKILKYYFLTTNLRKTYKISTSNTLNIYIYESWHKKYIINFWTFCLMFFLIIYYTFWFFIFSFLNNSNVINLTNNWYFYIVIIILLICIFMFFYLNHYILKQNIKNYKEEILDYELEINQLKLFSQSIKNDYKYLTLGIIFLLLIFPLFLLFSKKIRIFLKEI